MGRDERRLHTHAERPENSGHDYRGVVRGAHRVAGPAVRLERPGLSGPHQHPATVHGQPGHRLSDIRHVFHVLRAPVGHIVPVLEDIQNSPEKDTAAAGPAERHAGTLEVSTAAISPLVRVVNIRRSFSKYPKNSNDLVTNNYGLYPYGVLEFPSSETAECSSLE